MAIQQRHITCAQQVLAAHKQPSLLAALSPLLPSQQPYSQQRQHLLHVQSWQQLWPSQRRGFCSSSASQSKPVWPNAVPSLHQPQKHLAGQLVRKPPEQFTPGAAAAADSSAVKPAEALAAKAENIWGRIRITLIRGVLCITIPATSKWVGDGADAGLSYNREHSQHGLTPERAPAPLHACACIPESAWAHVGMLHFISEPLANCWLTATAPVCLLPRTQHQPCSHPSCCAVVVVYRHILLGSSAAYLRTANPLAHKSALKHLRWWLRWRATFGEALVQQMVSYAIFQPLVGLVQPGTDACEFWRTGQEGYCV